MKPVAVDAQLLKVLMPEVNLRVGSVVAARVIQRSGDRGLLSLAGRQLEAQLPSGLEAGRTLRLEVQDVSPERLLLRVADPTTAMVPVATLPLPGEQAARVYVTERDAEGDREGETTGVSLAYESATLGRIDLRLEQAGGAVRVNVGAAAGPPAERAEAAARELHDALAGALGKPAQVTVTPRHDPFDTYA